MKNKKRETIRKQGISLYSPRLFLFAFLEKTIGLYRFYFFSNFFFMHLVIMAAGEGSRMRPITDTTPKPLLQICGRTIIEHNIDPILDTIDEIYMIVKYKSEMFREHFSDTYR